MNYSKEVLDKNYKEKKEIIEKIQSLSQSEDINSAIAEVKMLSQRFLSLGFVGRDNFKEIFHEFNAVKKGFYNKVNNGFYNKVDNTLS